VLFKSKTEALCGSVLGGGQDVLLNFLMRLPLSEPEMLPERKREFHCSVSQSG
jgi:hypothetical protein